MTILAILATAALFTPQTSPMPPESTGILAEKSITFLRDAESTLRVSHAGGGSEPMSSHDPKFAQQLLDPALPSTLRINSFSRGMGNLTTELLGGDRITVLVPSGGWAFLCFNLVNRSSTDPWTGIYAVEDAAAGGMGGDLFYLVMDGSEAAFPPEDIGTIQKMRDGLDFGATNLRGHDSHMPGWTLGPELAAETGTEGELFFFTVAHPTGTTLADYASIPGDWGIGQSGTEWKGPGTIFVVEYENGSWQTPKVHKRIDELGLTLYVDDDPLNPLTVIDGLCVTANAANLQILLSTTDSDDHQLWAVGSWGTVQHGPLYIGAKKAVKRLGASGRQVRSICGNDPGPIHANGGGHTLPHIRHCQRTAVVDPGALGSSLVGIAAHRIPKNSSTDSYRFLIQGFLGQSDSSANLMQISRNGQAVAIPGATVTRNAALGVDRRYLSIDVTGTAEPEKLQFRWDVFDRSGQLLGSSHEFYLYSARN